MGIGDGILPLPPLVRGGGFAKGESGGVVYREFVLFHYPSVKAYGFDSSPDKGSQGVTAAFQVA